MTDTPDPRIEAVAKLLFTGPMWGYNIVRWDWPSFDWAKSVCLMAAEDVLRGIDEAAAWEYGVQSTSGRGVRRESEWTGWSWLNDLDGARRHASTLLDPIVLRRRPPGDTEIVPVATLAVPR